MCAHCPVALPGWATGAMPPSHFQKVTPKNFQVKPLMYKPNRCFSAIKETA